MNIFEIFKCQKYLKFLALSQNKSDSTGFMVGKWIETLKTRVFFQFKNAFNLYFYLIYETNR